MFLKFINYSFQTSYLPLRIYTPITFLPGLLFLFDQRQIVGTRFLNGLLKGTIDSSTFLSSSYFKVILLTSRSFVTFCVPHATTNYLTNVTFRNIVWNNNSDPSSLFKPTLKLYSII